VGPNYIYNNLKIRKLLTAAKRDKRLFDTSYLELLIFNLFSHWLHCFGSINVSLYVRPSSCGWVGRCGYYKGLKMKREINTYDLILIQNVQ
jgi:hypothetical protein